MKQLISIKILSTDKILYEGEGLSVSSVNRKGKFDVLADHGNFISLINEGIKIRDKAGNLVNIPIAGGILRVKDGNVEAYVNV